MSLDWLKHKHVPSRQRLPTYCSSFRLVRPSS